MTTRRLVICVLALVFCAENISAADQYESWVREYSKGPLGGVGGDIGEIQLKITVVEGDDLKIDEKTASVLGARYRTYYHGCVVSTKGLISFFTFTPMGVQGGGPRALPFEDFTKLLPLIANLPDDHLELPPPGHRLVLQVVKGTGVLARVYDRANLPGVVLEILRLAGTNIKPLVTNFAPDKRWTPDKFRDAVIPPHAIGIRSPKDILTLAVSPDRSLLVQQALLSRPTTQVTDSKTKTIVHEVTEPQSGSRMIYITHAWFTPDGRYLLLLSNLPATRIYDRVAWKELDTLPELPSGGVAYYPSSDWAHGLVVSAAGEVDLWDAAAHRKVAKLEPDGETLGASFSPDGSLFAMTSVSQSPEQPPTFHLRVWETKSGNFVHELMPLVQVPHDQIGDPIWWPDGRYLFAPVREDLSSGSYVVGIWNVPAGRYRGGFAGCDYSDDPFSVLFQGQRLFKLCRDGILYMWDASKAIGRIMEFENSLAHGTARAARSAP